MLYLCDFNCVRRVNLWFKVFFSLDQCPSMFSNLLKNIPNYRFSRFFSK